MNGATRLEKSPGVDALAPQLTAMGHTVQVPAGEGSGLHGIERVKGGYIGGADPRRDGVVHRGLSCLPRPGIRASRDSPWRYAPKCFWHCGSVVFCACSSACLAFAK